MRRRTTFAASFVVTLASCTKPATPPENPTPEPATNDHDRDAPEEASAADTHWVVSTSHEAGLCQAMAETSCPEGASCNPPPPSRYPCPPTLAENDHLDVYQHPNDKTCFTRIMKVASMSCPRGASCNPPPPRMVEHPVDCPTE